MQITNWQAPQSLELPEESSEDHVPPRSVCGLVAVNFWPVSRLGHGYADSKPCQQEKQATLYWQYMNS